MVINLETLIYENYKYLNENDKYIWSYILNNKKECENMSIQDLASRCNVSHTTILRFAQKIGLNGYSELKFYLKFENKNKCIFNKHEVINASVNIKKTIDTLIKSDLSDVFNLLDSCSKIYAYGSGKVQLNAAKELQRSFLTVGKLINVIEGNEELDIIINYMTENDIIFLISLSGENDLINNFAKILNSKGIKIISVTQNGNNKLSKLSDISIQFYTNELAKLEDGISIFPLSQFFIINDFLIIKYLEYKYSN